MKIFRHNKKDSNQIYLLSHVIERFANPFRLKKKLNTKIKKNTIETKINDSFKNFLFKKFGTKFNTNHLF